MMAESNQSPSFSNTTCKHQHTLFCFDPDCTNQRLFCSDCLSILNHQGHKIAFINPNVEPLSRISSHCYAPNAKSLYTALSKKALSLSQSLETAQNLATSIFSTIRKRLLGPIWTITNTYSKETSQQAVHTLLKDSTNIQEIEIIVSKINYLLSINDNVETHLSKADGLEQQAKNIIRETFVSLQKIQENINSEINSGKKAEQLFEKSKKYEKYLAEKNKKIVQEIQEFKDMNQSSVNERNITSRSKENLEVSMKVEDSHMIEERQQPLKTRSRDKLKAKNPDKMLEQNERKKQRGKRGPKSKKKDEEFEESQKQEYQPDQYQEVNQTIMNPDVSSRPSVKSEQSGSEEIYEEGIKWTISSDHHIEELSAQTQKKISFLTIQSIPFEPVKLFNFIKQLIHLKELHIFDNVICIEQNIINLMKSLPRSLQKLYFNCSNEFNRNCIKILYKKKMKHLKHLEYFYNIRSLLRRADQSFYFRDKAQGVRVEPLNFSDTNYLIMNVPAIKNLWIMIKQYEKNKRKTPFKYNELEDLIVGELEEDQYGQQVEVYPLPSKLRDCLKETRSLRSLVLLNLQLEKDQFLKLVLQNEELETLYIEQCSGLNQEILTKIGKETKIVNYSFKECHNITGAFIQEVPEVNIWIMDRLKVGTTREELENPYTSFELCHKLTYINVYGNPFFNNELFGTLSNSFASLRSLNIGFTQCSDLCAPLFKHLLELQCLCLDENTLSAEGIFQICSPLTKLAKLSLCGYNGKKGKGELSSALLNDLGKSLPSIRHLSLRNCCRIGDDFELKDFHQLQIVETDKKVGESFISTLKFGGIKVYDDDSDDN